VTGIAEAEPERMEITSGEKSGEFDFCAACAVAPKTASVLMA
jgi:hypothetical protein